MDDGIKENRSSNFALCAEKRKVRIINSSIDKKMNVRYNVRAVKEVEMMINTNVTSFRKNVYGILEQAIKYNEPVNVSTKDGNAIIISEADYNDLMETLYLTSIPSMKEKIQEGLETPLSECVSEDEVEW